MAAHRYARTSVAVTNAEIVAALRCACTVANATPAKGASVTQYANMQDEDLSALIAVDPRCVITVASGIDV